MNDSLTVALEQVLNEPIDEVAVHPCAGGDINATFRVTCNQGDFFVKSNRADFNGLFQTERFALIQLAEIGQLPVPQVLGIAEVQNQQYLVLKYHEMQSLKPSGFFLAGQQLAHCHQSVGDAFGWPEQNFIGTTPQLNHPTRNWPEFYIEQRLKPQLRRLNNAKLNAFVSKLTAFKKVCEGYNVRPSLLHGDLWSGNVSAGANGTPIFFDPASYYGDRETDIAMTELFGGFPEDFYQGYQSVYPLSDGYSLRKPWYQLYHILNHANLFGGQYVAQAERLLENLTSD